MNLLTGNKCFRQPAPDSHTKRAETTNSYPPHPSYQFSFIGRGGGWEKRPIKNKKEEERKKKTNKGKLGKGTAVDSGGSRRCQRRAAQLRARPRHENYRAASQTYPCPPCHSRRRNASRCPPPGRTGNRADLREGRGGPGGEVGGWRLPHSRPPLRSGQWRRRGASPSGGPTGRAGNSCPHTLRMSRATGPGQPLGGRCAAEPEAGPKGREEIRTHSPPLTPSHQPL